MTKKFFFVIRSLHLISVLLLLPVNCVFVLIDSSAKQGSSSRRGDANDQRLRRTQAQDIFSVDVSKLPLDKLISLEERKAFKGVTQNSSSQNVSKSTQYLANSYRAEGEPAGDVDWHSLDYYDLASLNVNEQQSVPLEATNLPDELLNSAVGLGGDSKCEEEEPDPAEPLNQNSRRSKKKCTNNNNNNGMSPLKRPILEVVFGAKRAAFQCRVPGGQQKKQDRLAYLGLGKLALLDHTCITLADNVQRSEEAESGRPSVVVQSSSEDDGNLLVEEICFDIPRGGAVLRPKLQPLKSNLNMKRDMGYFSTKVTLARDYKPVLDWREPLLTLEDRATAATTTNTSSSSAEQPSTGLPPSLRYLPNISVALQFPYGRTIRCECALPTRTGVALMRQMDPLTGARFPSATREEEDKKVYRERLAAQSSSYVDEAELETREELFNEGGLFYYVDDDESEGQEGPESVLKKRIFKRDIPSSRFGTDSFSNPVFPKLGVAIRKNRILSPACCSYRGRPRPEDLLWPFEGYCSRYQSSQFRPVPGAAAQQELNQIHSRSWWTTEMCLLLPNPQQNAAAIIDAIDLEKKKKRNEAEFNAFPSTSLNRTNINNNPVSNIKRVGGAIRQFHTTKESQIHGSILNMGILQPLGDAGQAHGRFIYFSAVLQYY